VARDVAAKNGGAIAVAVVVAIAQWQTLFHRERWSIYFRQDNPPHNCTGSQTLSMWPSRGPHKFPVPPGRHQTMSKKFHSE